ncbi:MAG: hypothetical protein RUDDFDWM_000931 [Candidatus Fervidibacterota bacterium]
MPFTFSIHTLGCKVNQYDSEKLVHLLCKHGFVRKQFEEPVDVCIINTCAVTHAAERKSRKLVSRARRLNPNSVVVALGCAVQLQKIMGKESFPNADISIGVCETDYVLRTILEAIGREVKGEGSIGVCSGAESEQPLIAEQTYVRANLKVQDGCGRMCAFCVVPFLRGKPRSRPVEEVISEAKSLIASGCKEIVLCGICLGSYGVDLGGGVDLAVLIERLCELDGLVRLRLSSIDPRDVNERLIKVAAHCDKLCKHFHISLQSGDDELLKAMNRRYTTAQYERIVNTIRELMPEVAITTDVLVGFPGETEEQFENTLRFVERIGFARVHVFKFSPRPFTKAASIEPQVKEHVLRKRLMRMHSLAKELSIKFRKQFIGQKLDVLVEDVKTVGSTVWSEGLTGNYIKVRIPKLIKPGEVVSVRLSCLLRDDSVLGENGEGVVKLTNEVAQPCELYHPIAWKRNQFEEVGEL